MSLRIVGFISWTNRSVYRFNWFTEKNRLKGSVHWRVGYLCWTLQSEKIKNGLYPSFFAVRGFIEQWDHWCNGTVKLNTFTCKSESYYVIWWRFEVMCCIITGVLQMFYHQFTQSALLCKMSSSFSVFRSLVFSLFVSFFHNSSSLFPLTWAYINNAQQQ